MAESSCAYDRFVATPIVAQAVVQASVVDVEGKYGLSSEEMSVLSDHYPIQVVLDADKAFSAAAPQHVCSLARLLAASP